MNKICEDIIKVCANIIKLTEDAGISMNTTTAGMMDVQPITLAGEEQPSKKYEKETKNSEKKAMLGYKYQKSRESRKSIVQQRKSPPFL